jgi:hypothetical protein
MTEGPQRHKASFVANGFSQWPGVDFKETYASVVTAKYTEQWWQIPPKTTWRPNNLT